jgi:hypothetical protein
VVGCEDGVRAYSAFVDDAGSRGSQALLDAVDAVSRLPSGDPLASEQERADARLAADLQAAEVEAALRPGAAGASAAGGRPLRDLCAVSLAQACHAQTYSRSVVSGISATGATIWASEFLGSLTVSQLEWDAKAGKPLLVPR